VLNDTSLMATARNVGTACRRGVFLHRGLLIKKTPWPESASELYRQSDRRLSAKLVPNFADSGIHVVSVTEPYGRILGFLDRFINIKSNSDTEHYRRQAVYQAAVSSYLTGLCHIHTGDGSWLCPHFKFFCFIFESHFYSGSTQPREYN
jgi:hypothetical protein